MNRLTRSGLLRQILRFIWGNAILLVMSCAAQAGEYPLWEAGIGMGALSLPDYRGSDERTLYSFPVPYLVYRGEVLKIDRRAARGILFHTERAELNVSLNASPPVNSRKNSAREGMPDLDPTGEIGPSLHIDFGERRFFSAAVSVQLPFRLVAATDLSYIRQAGYVFNPRINLEWETGDSGKGWNAGITAGPLFTDKKLNAYYYAVDPAFATATRPQYAARGGYGGFQATAGLSRRFQSIWFGAFLRIDSLHRAAFEDSPLVRTPYSFMFGLALSRVLAVSGQTVSAKNKF